MKALVMTGYGGPEVMELRDMAEPEAGPEDLKIDVHAAALNPVDWKIRAGMLKAALRYKMPQIMGNDLSGTVSAVGEKVTKFKVGDEVYARPHHERMGAFAETAVVNEAYAARKPQNLSHVEAASIPLVGLTSWQALVDLMNIESGQKVFIHAGAGGVGTFAIQLAKHRETVVTTTASPKNHDFLRDLGADQVIDYHTEDFTTEPDAYDAVFDTIGGKILRQSFQIVKRGGWVVSIASMPDPITAQEMGIPLPMRLALRFMTRQERGLAKAKDVHYRMLLMQPNGKELGQITELIEANTIKPIIDSTHPLEDYAKAFAHLEDGHARGKIVFAIRD